MIKQKNIQAQGQQLVTHAVTITGVYIRYILPSRQSFNDTCHVPALFGVAQLINMLLLLSFKPMQDSITQHVHPLGSTLPAH